MSRSIIDTSHIAYYKGRSSVANLIRSQVLTRVRACVAIRVTDQTIIDLRDQVRDQVEELLHD